MLEMEQIKKLTILQKQSLMISVFFISSINISNTISPEKPEQKPRQENKSSVKK